MVPRSLSSILCALVLASLCPPSFAGAAPVDPRTSPLLLEFLRHHSLPPSVTAQAQAARTPLASVASDPFHALPTALPSLLGSAVRPTSPAAARFTAPTTAGSGTSKLPSGQGVVGDNYGAALTTAGDMFGDGVSDVAVGAPYAVGLGGATGEVIFYYGTPGPPPPVTSIWGEAPFDGFGSSVAGVGDVNGDGYPDLLVGAPFHAVNGNPSQGKAYLYLGSPTGIQTAPTWVFSTGGANADVGYSVAWAGDINGDGYDDWLVGAPGYSNGEVGEGAVFLFLGGSGALSNVPAWSFESNLANAELGFSVAGAGDMNGDGFPDIVVGAPGWTGLYAQEGLALLFFGHNPKPSLAPDKTWRGGQAQAFFGSSVAAAGDVNGDGYADVILGAPQFDNAQINQGRALVAYGASLPALFPTPSTLEENIAGARFGTAVATAGDINGDGYADVIVGAPSINNGTNFGQAFVFVGSQLGVIPFIYDGIQSPVANEQLGGAVGTMGHFFNDGFSDYWAGSPGNANGSAWAHFGHSFTPGFNEAVAAQGYTPGLEDGFATAAADVNGDGFDDLIVASYHSGDNQPYDGKASIYFGGRMPFQPAGLSPLDAPAPDWTYEGDADDYFGLSLANAGDVNGDGYQDFIAGAPFHSVGLNVGMGEALLFYGSPSGPVGGTPWKVEGTQLGGLMGYSVTGGGDLNGDGYDDVAVTIPQGDQGIPFEGVVNVYYGSKFGLAHVPAVTLRGHQDHAFLGTGACIVGDINRDGYDDLVTGAAFDSVSASDEGQAYVHYGSPTGPHALADDSLRVGSPNANFAWSIFRIGDVNGDGYADVAVGAPNFTDTQTDEGKVFVYLGSPTGLQKPAAWTLEGGETNATLGLTGVSGGDLNGDGFSDLVVGSPNSDLNAADAGWVRVFLGSPGGLDTFPAFDEQSSSADLRLGYAVGGRADFDGDGFSDLFYTAPGLNLFGADEGGAFVRYGNTIWFGTQNQDRPLAAWRADDSAPISPGLRSDATTSFRLRGKMRSVAGRTSLRLESEVKPAATPFSAGGHVNGAWQATGPVVAPTGTSAPVDQLLGGLAGATRYHWRARFASRNLFFPFSAWFGPEQRSPTERHLATAGAPLAVGVDPTAAPAALALAPASPNPSAGAAARLGFTLPRDGNARLALYDLRGRLVRTLFDAAARAGRTDTMWDGKDAAGALVPAGAYFARLTALGEERTEKLVRLR